MIWRISFFVLLGAIVSVYTLTTGCDSSCKTCVYFNDATACSSCNSTMTLVLINNDYGYCTDKNCSEISGLSFTDPDTGNKKCFIGGYCPSGYYAKDSECLVCDKGCTECFGPNATQCLRCPSGKLLNISDEEYGGECIDKSACGATIFGNNAVCGKNDSCDASCNACIGPSPKHCTSCKEATKVLSVENIADGVSWGTCSDTVSLKRTYSGFGIDPNNSLTQYKCHWTCQGCVAENDRFACTACSSSAYLNVVSELNGMPVGNCKPKCESGREKALVLENLKLCSDSGECPLNSTGDIVYKNGACSRNSSCSAACGLCDGSTASDCTLCPNWNDWLRLSTETKGSCGTFPTSSKFVAHGKRLTYASDCAAPFTTPSGLMCTVGDCNVTHCVSCGSDKNRCWKCESGYLIQTSATSTIEGECVKDCSSGYFRTSDNRCIKCHSTCGSCSEGLAPEKCTSCASGRVLAEDGPAPCIEACPEGFNNDGGVCRAAGTGGGGEESSGTPGWAIGAIIIGIFSMLGFFGFVAYMVLEWKKEAAPPAEPKEEKKEPAVEAKKEEKNVA